MHIHFFDVVVLNVKPKEICAVMSTCDDPGWQRLIPHLTAYWLPGNANFISLYNMYDTVLCRGKRGQSTLAKATSKLLALILI